MLVGMSGNESRVDNGRDFDYGDNGRGNGEDCGSANVIGILSDSSCGPCPF